MSTITFQEKLNSIYSKTSNAFAEQEAKSYDDEVNNFLDFLNECKESLTIINGDYEEFLDSFANELAQTKSKKDLILLRERALPLYNISKKLIKTTTSNTSYRIGLKTILADFQMYVEDLQELLSDVEKKLNDNKKINDLLGEIVNYNS